MVVGNERAEKNSVAVCRRNVVQKVDDEALLWPVAERRTNRTARIGATVFLLKKKSHGIFVLVSLHQVCSQLV